MYLESVMIHLTISLVEKSKVSSKPFNVPKIRNTLHKFVLQIFKVRHESKQWTIIIFLYTTVVAELQASVDVGFIQASYSEKKTIHGMHTKFTKNEQETRDEPQNNVVYFYRKRNSLPVRLKPVRLKSADRIPCICRIS